MSATKLLPCPFCGGEAVRREVNYCLTRGFQVHCVRCHSATPAYYMGYDPFTGKEASVEETSTKAVSIWNSRRATT